MLIKVKAPPGGKRTEVRELAEIFRGRVVDVVNIKPIRQGRDNQKSSARGRSGHQGAFKIADRGGELG